jgi:hypothetical protein
MRDSRVEVGVASHSSGGAYALVCAAQLGERVLGGAVALLADERAEQALTSALAEAFRQGVGGFRLLPGHGHLTILSELPAIASALLRTTG